MKNIFAVGIGTTGMAATIDKEHANKVFDMLADYTDKRIKNLEGELSIAKYERNQADEKVGELEDKIEELEENIDELEDSIVAHKNENDSLKEQIEKQKKDNEMLLWAVEKTEKTLTQADSRNEERLKYELQKQKEEYEARIKQLELRVAGEEASRFRLGKTWDREEAELKSQLLKRNEEVMEMSEREEAMREDAKEMREREEELKEEVTELKGQVEWLTVMLAHLKQDREKKEQYLVAPWGRDDVNSILDGWGLPDLTDEQWLKLYNGAPDQLGFSDSHNDDYLGAIKDCLKEILDIHTEEVECCDTQCPKEYHTIMRG